jgi:hypothetical protein
MAALEPWFFLHTGEVQGSIPCAPTRTALIYWAFSTPQKFHSATDGKTMRKHARWTRGKSVDFVHAAFWYHCLLTAQYLMAFLRSVLAESWRMNALTRRRSKDAFSPSWSVAARPAASTLTSEIAPYGPKSRHAKKGKA